MPKENVEAVHRGVDAMNRGELDSLLDLVDEEIVWEPRRASFEGAFAVTPGCAGTGQTRPRASSASR